MKYKLTALVVMLLAAVPVGVFAHGGTTAEEDQSNDADSEVTAEEFSQIEDTMIKMMNDEALSDDEITEMNEFMSEHNADGFMMPMYDSGGAYRMPMSGWSNGTHMFGQWGAAGGFPFWFGFAIQLVWLFAGVLLVAFLIKKLRDA